MSGNDYPEWPDQTETIGLELGTSAGTLRVAAASRVSSGNGAQTISSVGAA